MDPVVLRRLASLDSIDGNMLTMLYHVGTATTSQIQRATCSRPDRPDGGLRFCRDRIRRLKESKLCVYSRYHGRGKDGLEQIVGLSPAGQAVAAERLGVPRRKTTPSFAHARHSAILADAYAHLHLIAQRSQGFITVEWFSGAEARIGDIWPDAKICLLRGSTRLAVFLEADTGSEPLATIRSKIQRYLRSGVLNGDTDPTIVVFVCTSTGRMKSVAAVIREARRENLRGTKYGVIVVAQSGAPFILRVLELRAEAEWTDSVAAAEDVRMGLEQDLRQAEAAFFAQEQYESDLAAWRMRRDVRVAIQMRGQQRLFRRHQTAEEIAAAYEETNPRPRPPV